MNTPDAHESGHEEVFLFTHITKNLNRKNYK
jgi:hypothetical protein